MCKSMYTSHVSRLLAFVSLTTAAVVLVPAAVAGPTLTQVPMLGARAPQPGLQLAARKGTRLYRSETDASGSAQGTGDLPAVTPTNALENCLETWDSATHISKSRWREICKQQIKERQDLEAGVVQ